MSTVSVLVAPSLPVVWSVISCSPVGRCTLVVAPLALPPAHVH
jgi:hypothetical protein